MICITGTDGKTTTSTLLYYVLQAAGKKVALISTVAAYIGTEAIDTGFHVTTPTPWQLQKLLAKIRDLGYEYVVLETTSQGIYQFRTWGITPFIAAVTNITGDHLDYHLTYELYVQAKTAKLAEASTAVVNKDDVSYTHILPLLRSEQRIIEYSLQQQLPKPIQRAISDRFSQPYNHANSRCVYAIARELELEDQAFIDGLNHFTGVPGRMQVIPNKKGIQVIVDFAHTANALYQALSSLQSQRTKDHQLIVVYGCAGLRDATKRAAMTKHAVELADQVVLTAEDPRTEDIWTIFRQMKEQLTQGQQKIQTVPDRFKAIEFALTKLAKKGDTVIIAGKGHEQSMCYGTTEYLWNDEKAVEQVMGS